LERWRGMCICRMKEEQRRVGGRKTPPPDPLTEGLPMDRPWGSCESRERRGELIWKGSFEWI
jgi:hypothetical protein